jgi:hypothetical protein
VKRRETKVHFTMDETSLAFGVVAGLRAESYTNPAVRSLIYKCKAADAALADGGVRVVIHG